MLHVIASFLGMSLMVLLSACGDGSSNKTSSDKTSINAIVLKVDPLTTQYFPITPTGQDNCYNNSAQVPCSSIGGSGPPRCGEDKHLDYCGQDAQYASKILKRFSLGGTASEHFATDSISGLVWQVEVPALTLQEQEAAIHCKNLTFGGKREWQLPTPHELLSIVNNNRSYPSIDTEVFADAESLLYVSSSSRSVFFRYGTAHSYYVSPTQEDRVRCVISNKAMLQKDNIAPLRFSKQTKKKHDYIIIDELTKLEWSYDYQTDLTWKQALAYCESLSYGGYLDWRLPNKNELISLVDFSKTDPASDFPNLDIVPYIHDIHHDMPNHDDFFWTSTTVATLNFAAWNIFFFTGAIDYEYKLAINSARCVRH